MKVDKKALIRWKVYLDRSKMYIGYINLLMMVTIFVKAIQNTLVGKFLIEHAIYTIPVLFVVFIFLALVLGYFDSRLGIRSEELRNLSVTNPVQMEILETLREIRKHQMEESGKVKNE